MLLLLFLRFADAGSMLRFELAVVSVLLTEAVTCVCCVLFVVCVKHHYDDRYLWVLSFC